MRIYLSGIPEEWLNKLAERERLASLANALFDDGMNRRDYEISDDDD